MWSTYEHREGDRGSTRQAEDYARNLAHKRCAVRQVGEQISLDYGPAGRLAGVTATVARMLQSAGPTVVLEAGVVVVTTRTRVDALRLLRLVPVASGGLSRADEARNLAVAVSLGVPGHQAPLTGVLGDLLSRAGGRFDADPDTFRHEVTLAAAVAALRAGCERRRDALPASARYGTQATTDDAHIVVDNGGSVWPATLTNTLSDTRFGLVAGRRKAGYAASWTYVPVVLDDEGQHAALRCMELSELARGFTWFTRANRRALQGARTADPEWAPGWTETDAPDDPEEDDAPAVFGWAPLPADRDSVVRLIRSEGASQCQQTWTQMGTMAHERLCAYDLLFDDELRAAPPAPDPGACHAMHRPRVIGARSARCSRPRARSRPLRHFGDGQKVTFATDPLPSPSPPSSAQ